MWTKITLALGAIALILIAVIARQPSTFAIERSTQIAAPADIVYGHIHNLRAMDGWSPWLKMDPQQVITHEGPEADVGASESWDGPEIGKGRMTITRVLPNQEVELRLEFEEPMEATNTARFTLVPSGDATHVTWRMEGRNNFVGKAASLVMDMDEMVGGTFEQGLASLKMVAEDAAEQRRAELAAAQAAEAAAQAAAGEPAVEAESPDVAAPPPSEE